MTSPTDTQVSPQQLEAIAKKANWEQAKIVYAEEIEKLLISARLDENKMYLQETNRHYFPAGPDDPHIPVVQFHERMTELQQQIEVKDKGNKEEYRRQTKAFLL